MLPQEYDVMNHFKDMTIFIQASLGVSELPFSKFYRKGEYLPYLGQSAVIEDNGFTHPFSDLPAPPVDLQVQHH